MSRISVISVCCNAVSVEKTTKKCGHYSSQEGEETLSLNVQLMSPRGEGNQGALLPRLIQKKWSGKEKMDYVVKAIQRGTESIKNLEDRCLECLLLCITLVK